MILRVAVIGFGLSGRYLQCPFFNVHAGFELQTILSFDSDPHLIFPEAKVARSFEEVLHDSSIDLVSVCTPNATHYDYVKRCLLAGKHVLVEKPMTASASEAEELFDLALKCNKVLYVHQNRRFDSDFLTIKHVIENGWLGELVNAEFRFDRYRPQLNPKKWKELPAPASGILYDLGSHIIDQALALFGTPLAVDGQVFQQRDGTVIDDSFDVRLNYGRLNVSLKSSLLVREPTPRYVLHGTKGSFVKYGIDVQEDHLRAGMLPTDAQFGIEPIENWGILNAEIDGLHIQGKVETIQGSWWKLYDNLYDIIANNSSYIIKPEQILEQLSIIEKTKP
jgi:scyllo-inositol 2-dehydrogenase (NADP+)